MDTCVDGRSDTQSGRWTSTLVPESKHALIESGHDAIGLDVGSRFGIECLSDVNEEDAVNMGR